MRVHLHRARHACHGGRGVGRWAIRIAEWQHHSSQNAHTQQAEGGRATVFGFVPSS